MTPKADPALGALVGSFGYDREASLLGAEDDFAAVLWHVDHADPLAFEVEVPVGVSLVCAHLTGSIDWTCDSDRVRYARPCLPGTLNITPGGTKVAVTLAQARADVIHFYLPDRLLAETSEREDTARDLIDPMNAEDRPVADFARRATRALRLGGAVGRLQAQAAGLNLAAHIVQTYSHRAAPTARAHGGLPPARLRAVLERMRDELRDEPSLLELADLARVGAKHFMRAFKQSTGTTAHAWLMERRLGRAQQLLASGSLPIAEIAVACGFADQSHFTAAFRKALGATPASYRRGRLQ